ncbi:Hypothetical protein GbCGDNIH2_8043 [Granulibacter bethesdensis]|uniref:Uncharacterized protein n=2 Tax=Granulibacter bethesdensis TaxID=364410 RepID=A0A286M2T7_GRABC|nr:Hypothetical protein GbCGDNIH3_8043 [Granulibacter bethesdensis]APG31100.1 Hypothetical protein GbCGDNIH4_8043 [Granulibacter bethesdensis CGDNIH4]ASV62336.1 Hypothetical protein GbCGDNIH1_8043 [Granulibacter bethesdensis CGDNIH1]APG30582.1 Hypothetical protein GbCGDNIH2_8043 [Granulibacter bethesdensis]APH50748.1 Hypothetical protein GbCGDNIH5_8043 [Granulibacter bethesdensis]
MFRIRDKAENFCMTNSWRVLRYRRFQRGRRGGASLYSHDGVASCRYETEHFIE